MGILRVILLLSPPLRMFGHFHNETVFLESPLTLRGSGEPQDVPYGERDGWMMEKEGIWGRESRRETNCKKSCKLFREVWNEPH